MIEFTIEPLAITGWFVWLTGEFPAMNGEQGLLIGEFLQLATDSFSLPAVRHRLNGWNQNFIGIQNLFGKSGAVFAPISFGLKCDRF